MKIYWFYLCLCLLVIGSHAQMVNPVIIEKARFTVIAPECIRLEYAPTGAFIDQPSLFAVDRDAKSSDFSLMEENGTTIIATQRVRLYYRPNGAPFAPENLWAEIDCAGEMVRWVPGMANKANLGGTLRTLDQVRGKVPVDDGILARDGWYVLDDSKRPLLTKDWVMQRPEGGIDWYLFAYGLDYKAALRAFAKIAGPVPLPRKYMLGSWYSRYWPYSSDEYRQIVAEYKEHDFPLDIMVLDMDWHKDGWTGWSWNRQLLPDAEQLLEWFHKQGIFVTLNLHPAEGIKPHEDMYEAFMKDMGYDVSHLKPRLWPTLPYDASNKKYLDTLFKHTHTPLEKVGVDFWWLDWQQFENTIGNAQLKNLEWLNHYYFQHSSKGDLRGASFSRWGGWGDHKHPIHFSGDAVSIWPMLEFEVPFTSTAGNVGCFFWSHDIGGHFGGITPETNCRWIQFGAFTAALRLHSTRDASMDKRPWLSEPIYTNSMRKAFHLRSQLFPYIYSSAWYSCQNTIPFTKPMYIEYPDQAIAYECPQQYFFGEHFLVAPIASQGAGDRKVAGQRVWFPKGTWYNWLTGERYEGRDAFVQVWSDIDELPLYVKGGQPIPTQAYTPRMATEPLKNLVIRVYPGEEGHFTLYEDDGTSKAYLNDQFSLTQIHYRYEGITHRIVIDPVQGEYAGQLQERSYTIEFAGQPKEIELALVQGKTVETVYDPEQGIHRIEVPMQSIQKRVLVQLMVKQTLDFQDIHTKAQRKRLLGMVPDYLQDGELRHILATAKPIDHSIRLAFLSGISLHTPDKETLVILKAQDSKVSEPLKVEVHDWVGDTKTVVLQKELLLQPGESEVIKLQHPLEKQFGVTTIRTVQVGFTLQDLPVNLRKTLDSKDPYLSECLLVGPFPFDRHKSITDYVHVPETQDLSNPSSLTYLSKEGKIIQWQPIQAQSDFIFDIRRVLDYDDSIAYALVFLQSTEGQPVTFEFNSDDGIEVWLNGKKIHSHNVFRSVFHDPEQVEAALQKGSNALLFKISQGVGGWCFKSLIRVKKAIQTTLIKE